MAPPGARTSPPPGALTWDVAPLISPETLLETSMEIKPDTSLVSIILGN